MLEQQLQQMGLSPKEAKVYLAGLELGYAPVQDISHKAGVNRATTYFIIEQLQKKGLFSYFHKGKKRYFTAEAPDALKGYLDQQEAQLGNKREKVKKLIPQLEALHSKAKNKPTVKFFEGVEGIKAIQKDIMKSKDKTTEAVFCLDDTYELFPPSKKDHRHIMLKKGIRFKNLFSAQKPNAKYLMEGPGIENVKLNAKEHPIKVDISLYDQKIAIIGSQSKNKKEAYGIIIEDPDTVTTLRTLFYLALEKAKEKK